MTGKTVVPEEAVEAAAQALWQVHPLTRENVRSATRRALEAAAPHMGNPKSYGTSRRLGVSSDVEVPIVRTGKPSVTVVNPELIAAKALEDAADEAPGRHDEVISAEECRDWAEWLTSQAAAVRGEG